MCIGAFCYRWGRPSLEKYCEKRCPKDRPYLAKLGDDAAHIEAKEFEDVAPEEIEVAVEFTKKLLKAIYHYNPLQAPMIGLNKEPD